MYYSERFLTLFFFCMGAFFIMAVLYGAITKYFFVPTKSLKIAVAYWQETPIVLSIRKGLFDELERLGLSYEAKVYDCNGNSNLISSYIEDVIDQEYDLLFTLGVPVTVRAQGIMNNKKIDMPIVFVGIAKPEDYNLIESREKPGGTITGVAFDSEKYYDIKTRVEILFEVRPNLKKVVIPFSDDLQPLYDEAILLEQEISRQAQKRGMKISVIKLPIRALSEVLERLKPHHDADAIILLRDKILGCILGIAKFCNWYNITLYASELESVGGGAGIAYGQREYYTGVAGAKVIYEILYTKRKPGDIPIQSFFNAEVVINEKTKDLQGISFERHRVKNDLLKGARFYH